MLLTRTLLVLLAFAVGAPIANADDAWQIVATTGAVKAGAPGVMPIAVNSKQTLPVDSWVETGATGRVVLTRHEESIAIGPSSRVMLPAQPVNGNTQVLQTVGTALYQIGKQKAPHFQVDTPYLAAVVKGTTFTVSVSEGLASVDVSEGLVQVATPDGADSAFVNPGFTGLVSQRQRDTVVVVPTGDGSSKEPGLAPKGGKSDRSKETSNTKGRVIITAAIGEVSLDVKSASGGLVTSTDSTPSPAKGKLASTLGTVLSGVTGVIGGGKSDGASTSAGPTVSVTSDAGGTNVAVGAGGVASVDVGVSGGGVGASVDVGGGVAAVDVTAGSGGVSVDVAAGGATVGVDLGVGGGNGNGSGGGTGGGGGLGLGIGLGNTNVGVGVGNGGVGVGLNLGLGGGGGGLGLGIHLGGRGS